MTDQNSASVTDMPDLDWCCMTCEKRFATLAEITAHVQQTHERQSEAPRSFPSVFTTPAELEQARERLADVNAKLRSPHVYTASYLAGYIKRLASSGTINPAGLREALAVAEAWAEWADLPERRQTCAMCGRVLTPNVFHTCPGPRVVSTGTAGLTPRADVALSSRTERVGVGADGCGCPITAEMISVNGELRSDVENTDRTEHRPGCWNAPDVTEGPEIVAADGTVA